jgi:hypothetical protein
MKMEENKRAFWGDIGGGFAGFILAIILVQNNVIIINNTPTYNNNSSSLEWQIPEICQLDNYNIIFTSLGFKLLVSNPNSNQSSITIPYTTQNMITIFENISLFEDLYKQDFVAWFKFRKSFLSHDQPYSLNNQNLTLNFEGKIDSLVNFMLFGFIDNPINIIPIVIIPRDLSIIQFTIFKDLLRPQEIIPKLSGDGQIIGRQSLNHSVIRLNKIITTHVPITPLDVDLSPINSNDIVGLFYTIVYCSINEQEITIPTYGIYLAPRIDTNTYAFV